MSLAYYTAATVCDIAILAIGICAVCGLHHWLTTRPKRNRYRPTHDPRNWQNRYRQWWTGPGLWTADTKQNKQ